MIDHNLEHYSDKVWQGGRKFGREQAICDVLEIIEKRIKWCEKNYALGEFMPDVYVITLVRQDIKAFADNSNTLNALDALDAKDDKTEMDDVVVQLRTGDYLAGRRDTIKKVLDILSLLSRSFTSPTLYCSGWNDALEEVEVAVKDMEDKTE